MKSQTAQVTQNCSVSVPREYFLKVLELLHLLQYIAAYLQQLLNWVSGETQYLGIFIANVSFPLDRTQLQTDQAHV